MKTPSFLPSLGRRRRQSLLSSNGFGPSSPRQAGAESKDLAIRLALDLINKASLLMLPDTVILLILSQDLPPKDLLAVSHTCQKLRVFSSTRSLWAAALEGCEIFPKLPVYPILSLGMRNLRRPSQQTLETLHHASKGEIITFPTKVSSLLLPTDNTHPREAYLNTQRRKHRLSHASGPVILHPRITAVQAQYEDFLRFRLNPGGDILAILMTHEMIVFDLHENRKYRIKIQAFGYNTPAAYFGGDRHPFSVERFHYGSEGALLVFMLNWREVGLLFQPFSSKQCGARLLGSIPVNQPNEFVSLWMSGVHLILSEKESGRGFLRTCNLVTGEVEKLSGQGVNSYNAEIYHQGILATPDIIMASAKRLGFSKSSLKPQSGSTTVPIVGTFGAEYIYLPPAALVNTSAAAARIMTVCSVAADPGGIMPATVKFTDGSVEATGSIGQTAAFPRDALPSNSLPKYSRARSTLSNPLLGMSRLFSGTDKSVIARRCVPSGQHLLSLICSRSDPYVGLVLSQRDVDSAVTHRPVHLCGERGDIRPMFEPSLPYWNIHYFWSDYAGCVVIQAQDSRDPKKFAIQVYDL
ncbi:hypothetical protein DL93DRAFT_767726 [Clavulina sp. PMI_390]|nr:hypothetical protein DL93DRAFT_767726 [Clavulina sp. PMI_390]